MLWVPSHRSAERWRLPQAPLSSGVVSAERAAQLSGVIVPAFGGSADEMFCAARALAQRAPSGHSERSRQQALLDLRGEGIRPTAA